MIIERPLHSHVDAETPDFDAMGFVLDMSLLGDSLGSGEIIQAWRSHIEDSTLIHIFRGGTRTGLGLRTDVGLATIVLYNAEDPLDGSTLSPGQAIRITSDGEAIFTARIADIASSYRRSPTRGDLTPVVEITANDAVAIHASTMRFGARPPLGYETFEERIQRLLPTARTAVEAPPVNEPVEVYAF